MSVFDNFGDAEVSVDGNVESASVATTDPEPSGPYGDANGTGADVDTGIDADTGTDADTGSKTVEVVLRRRARYTSSSGTVYERGEPKEVSEDEAADVLEATNSYGQPVFERV